MARQACFRFNRFNENKQGCLTASAMAISKIHVLGCLSISLHDAPLDIAADPILGLLRWISAATGLAGFGEPGSIHCSTLPSPAVLGTGCHYCHGSIVLFHTR
ncbi:hypothetical protein THAOC_06172 [Thalassiosira oceanica]|uniref:Uncharacterized protein n=1 Tax=Thalassiosira oceanica TaxID=159749 RepID=K0TFG2_THAOC|nr:hypothetical protein THAOC_06172 [Thalassiosira oceanica]|eukprot:EJK72306.1 hypothetical protein THAOC_06172 [Thalassiosira oceanica]